MPQAKAKAALQLELQRGLALLPGHESCLGNSLLTSVKLWISYIHYTNICPLSIYPCCFGNWGSVPVGVQFRQVNIDQWWVSGVLDSGNPGGLRGVTPSLGISSTAATAQQCPHVDAGHVFLFIQVYYAYAQSHSGDLNNSQAHNSWKESPPLRLSDCNTVLHSLLVEYEDSIWLNWSR